MPPRKQQDEQGDKDQQGEPGVTQAHPTPEQRSQHAQPSDPEDAIKAQNVASSQSGVVKGRAVPKPRSEESEKAAEQASEVATVISDLTHQELTRLRGAVEHALSQKGYEPERETGPTLMELSDGLPVVEDDTDVESAASAVDVDEDQVISFAVRQANRDGKGIGPKYLRVVLADGSKQVTEV